MAKQKTVIVNGTEYTLQSVSPSWYFGHNDANGMTGGKRDTAKYIDVNTQGMAYFDAAEDIDTPEQLLREIESFLRGRS